MPINKAFAEHFLRGRDPVGSRSKRTATRETKTPIYSFTSAAAVVGVVDNEIQGEQFGVLPAPMVYLDYRQPPPTSAMLQVLALSQSSRFGPGCPSIPLPVKMRRVLKRVARDMTEMTLQPTEASIADSLNQRKLALRLVSAFGGVALVPMTRTHASDRSCTGPDLMAGS